MKSYIPQLLNITSDRIREIIPGTRWSGWLISAHPKENIFIIFRVYYIQSTDAQIKWFALMRMSKNKSFPILFIREQKGGTQVYERHLSADIQRRAFVDRSEWQIDTFTFNMIRHLTADVNKGVDLRIDAKS